MGMWLSKKGYEPVCKEGKNLTPPSRSPENLRQLFITIVKKDPISQKKQVGPIVLEPKSLQNGTSSKTLINTQLGQQPWR